MASWGKCDFEQLKALNDRIQRLQGKDFDGFCRQCSKELAARLLRKVIKRTPTGDYTDVMQWDSETGELVPSGKVGGTLKRGWTAKTHGEAASGSGAGNVTAYVNAMPITRKGDMFEVEIINPVKYASYVEYGHRQQVGRYVPAIGKRLTDGWVKGQFMLTISERELQAQAPRVLEKKLEKYLRGCFSDK